MDDDVSEKRISKVEVRCAALEAQGQELAALYIELLDSTEAALRLAGIQIDSRSKLSVTSGDAKSRRSED